MKKSYYFILAVLPILAVSCKQADIDDLSKCKNGLTVHASLQPAGDTKAVGQYRYDIVWEDGDRIAVLDAASTYAEFNLTEGAGTADGTFVQDGITTLTAPLTAYYPSSVASATMLEWPATQPDVTNITKVPMMATSTSTSGDIHFAFKQLGAVLQLVLTAKDGEIDVKQIDITADQGLSGEFTVNDGTAEILNTGTAISTGDISAQNITLSAKAVYLNFAIPAGDYTNFKITYTDKSGNTYSMSRASFSLRRAVVTRTAYALTAKGIKSVSFVPDNPDGLATMYYNEDSLGKIYSKDVKMSYMIEPASIAQMIASDPSLLTLRATYLNAISGTNSGLFDIPLTKVEYKDGLLNITFSHESVDDAVAKGTEYLNLSLLIDNGSQSVSTPFVTLIGRKSDYVLFEDDAFKSYCLGIADSNHDGEIAIATEAGSIESVSDIKNEFKSLQGINMFPNITAVDIYANIKIRKLDVSACRKLTDIDIRGCSNLQELSYPDDVFPSVRSSFNIGTALKVNGVNAIVSSRDGDQVKVISQQTNTLAWEERKDNESVGATSDNGYLNTNAILSATDKAMAASWCRSFGPTWYLPSKAEITAVYENKDAILANVKFSKEYNWFWSSNEDEQNPLKAWNVCFNVSLLVKDEKYLVLGVFAMKAL